MLPTLQSMNHDYFKFLVFSASDEILPVIVDM